ncbi:SVIL-like protein [Mya arenaria]|uniref:SVIL-like protein n=1 Tax=Mya arenaria TaxID=6604 RepID=A0ABY7ELS7_MYAAR|nr:SVIL-like protein [Mya arenaria]
MKMQGKIYKSTLTLVLQQPNGCKDASLSSRRADSASDDSLHTARVGVRRVSSSRLARENRTDSRSSQDKEVSTAISRLCEASEKEVAPVAKKPEEASRPIRRGNNFSQLLQKFSSSEASGSEKSDSESPRARKVLLKRQEACSLSSSSSESTRRTPERTQSLKLRNQPELTPQQNMDNSVQRSFSPEPDERRRLPATPVSQEQQDDKPSPELAKVLNKRSEIVTKQQEASEDVDRRKIHDGRVEHADRFSAARDDEVIADKEVLQMLRNRRKETDSSLSVSDSDSKSHTDTNKSAKQSKSVLNKTEAISDISKTPKSAISRRLNSQSSEERQKYRSEKLKTAVTGAKYSEKSQVPRLDLTSIDTSLNVLKTVTDDLEARDEVKAKTSVQGGKFTSELSHINVTSPTQVVQFIKSVEKDNQDSSVNTSEPSKGNDTEKIEVFSVPKQEIIVKSSSIEVESKNTANQQRGAININNKSEIMRKISTRDRTPERQVQKRTGPMKVMSPLNTEGTKTGLTRTESMGRTESERPKGILKRTPSLKTTGSMHVDPELAEVLRSRREQQEGVAEEDDDGLKLTAEEEIRKAREEAQDAESTPERELSVAERVFQMHNKIEEVRSCPITPRAFSGFSTPKALLQRSGTITPKNQSSIDEENQNKSSLSGPQLIERLSSLEGRQSDLAEKRSRFQQRRRRDDCRTRTQPVTLQEIQICDSLETVIKFRSEVIQKSSINVFESLQHPESKAVPLKKTEFPQHVPPRDRRSRNQRHKTLPVTAAELGAIPEGQVSETMNSLKKKFENFGAGRDSKADSGILSGSEVDHLERESESWRSLSVEENIGEDDPVKLSVSAKASLFHTKIEESVKKPSASGAKRYIDRKKRERSRTLPITEDEVKLAAEIADNEEKEEQEKKAAESGIVALATEEGNEQTDELVRQSLADKVKLFTTIEEEKKEAARKKGVLPPPRRKNRKQASRFATQPVTYEEVEKAAKISPLACSLVKPPDPEILSGLSVKAQRDLIAQHAAQTLSQPSSRAGSRTPSRATSISDLSGEIIQQDTLTASNTDQNRNFNAIDTGASPDSVKPSSVKTRGFEPVKSEESIKTPEKEKITTSLLDSSKKNVLKSQLEEKLSLFHRKPGGDSVMSVSDINKALKKAPPPDEEVSVSEEAEQVVVTVETVEVKSILKKEGSFETRKMDTVISQISSAIGPRKEASPVTESEENTTEGVESSGDNLDSDDAILDGTSARPSETSGSVDETEASHVKKKYMGRHFTQPVTPDEKKNAEIITDMPEVQKSGSIHDRLNALKKSGDEEWKKRVSRPLELDKLDRRSTSPETPVAIVKMREKTGSGVPRPSSIADRLSSLTGSQDGWRDRVGETDVKKFTVEHKLSSSGQTVNESPLVSRLRGKGLRKELSKDSDPGSPGLLSPSSPTKPTPREVTCPDLPPELIAPEETHSPLARIPSQEEDDKSGTSVMVPTIGDEVDKFFLKSDDVQGPREALNVSVDDFNELFLEANDMLESTRRVKPKRRHNPKSRNPLRTMSANLEVRSEYTEIITGVAERELKSVKKRDMGCKSAREVTTIEEKRGNLGNARHFWEIIACGPTEEDELYENHIVGTNMVYQLEGTRLVPMEEYWGNPPKYEMLTPDQVYVFDFGTELYLWQGKSATPNQRKISVKLAQQLWTQGYDYTSCEINPLSPLIDEDEGGLPRKADSRPDWALFGKVNQNMETILFREKFSDWPDTSRFIKVKGPEEVNPTKFDLADLKPYDAKEMVAVNTSPVSLMLEGSHTSKEMSCIS